MDSFLPWGSSDLKGTTVHAPFTQDPFGPHPAARWVLPKSTDHPLQDRATAEDISGISGIIALHREDSIEMTFFQYRQTSKKVNLAFRRFASNPMFRMGKAAKSPFRRPESS